jgi:hypothetical protein
MVDITYNAGTNTITVVGGSSGSPHNFTNVYNADVLGGWGKVTKQGTNQFDFQAKLQIGDDSTQTYFTDTYKQISFLTNIFTENGQNKILVMDKASFTLGKQSANLKQGYGGCNIISNETIYYGSLIKPNSNTSTCIINFFGCSFSTTETSTDQWVQGSKIYDCTFTFAAYLHTSTYTTGDIQLPAGDMVFGSKAKGALLEIFLSQIHWLGVATLFYWKMSLQTALLLMGLCCHRGLFFG